MEPRRISSVKLRWLILLAPPCALGGCSLLFSDYSDRFGDALDVADAESSETGDATVDVDDAHDASLKDIGPPTTCDAAEIPVTGFVRCPQGMCPTNTVCCVDPNTGFSCAPSCNTGHNSEWACLQRSDCPMAEPCCIGHPSLVVTLDAGCPCPVTLNPSPIGAQCLNTGECPIATNYTLCVDQGDCAPQTFCTPVVFDALVFGLCLP